MTSRLAQAGRHKVTIFDMRALPQARHKLCCTAVHQPKTGSWCNGQSERGKVKECNKLAAHARGRPAERNIRAARPSTPRDLTTRPQHRQRACNRTGSVALPTNTSTRSCRALCMQVLAHANQKVQHAKESTSQGHLPGRHRPASYSKTLRSQPPHIHTCSAVPEAPLSIFCSRLHRRPATTPHTHAHTTEAPVHCLVHECGQHTPPKPT